MSFFKRLQHLAGLNEIKIVRPIPNIGGYTGDLDFRYESTLRLYFDQYIPIDSNDPDSEEIVEKLQSRLSKMLKDCVLDYEEIEFDWRDPQEIEIHNIDQDAFWERYGEDFITKI